MPNPSLEPPASSKVQYQDFKDMDFLCTFKIKRERAKILSIDVPKTSDHIQINIRTQDLSQKHPASSKATNQDFTDMDFLCTFKIKMERAIIQNMSVSNTNDHIKIKIPNPSIEPPASSKGPNQDTKDMDVICTIKIKIESQNFEHGFIKDQ